MKTKIFTLLLLLGLVSMATMIGSANAAPVLTIGSSSGDVWDLQYRLKTLDFYTEPLDGVYGSQTKAAVAKFQKAYGISADGISGTKTWNILKKHTLNINEMDILAKVIYSESRGEPYVGQVAVGAVVMNRIQSSQFPDNIKEVVFQKGAFTAVSDGQYWLTPNQTAYLAALDAVRGWDPTNHSIYYFNPDTATSAWIWSRPQNLKIGKHIFAS
ncbi:spore cortex-lytic enzyme [Paenibacillus odorifer]|jgi:N-acetylmuramoyl-L-alanine amidase|uniref:spore cortex-lytic enzyme n=2 Tax=Paenibacillus TaxID=44249 RepID=UPI0009700EBB|nr:N-acetylmuramoyl-L-alanine amidase [Paenibacillus sp. PastH-4]MDH6443373.1 N-acetylmuramoyl-L-alanine amidase [Paenibacillus sp. PastF-4]MDH6525923.1 N-acetylmuramoyl-L-alanine amidase [Paenibacillus sp. PastH-3]OMD58830.1 spore cortex-lytic enzyme [Paenibacillus odorifer]OMD62348.1 spore cortex-lytic enzyme [Paenibacillus odorifer]